MRRRSLRASFRRWSGIRGFSLPGSPSIIRRSSSALRAKRGIASGLTRVRCPGHELCGVSSEVAALAAEKAWRDLKARVVRIALPNAPAPVSFELEKAFYPKAETIARACLSLLDANPDRVGDLSREDTFKGPY